MLKQNERLHFEMTFDLYNSSIKLALFYVPQMIKIAEMCVSSGNKYKKCSAK